MFFKKHYVPLTLFLLLLFLLGLGWGMNHFLKSTANTLQQTAQKIETAVTQNNWSQAKITFAQTQKEWEQIRQYWPLLIHHQEMDRIEECLAKMKSYLKHEDSNNTLAEIYVLLSYIQHIPESKTLNLQNIF